MWRLALALLLLGSFSCAETGDDSLDGFPGISRDNARHLREDSDEEFLEFARELKAPGLESIEGALLAAFWSDTDSTSSGSVGRQTILNALEKVALANAALHADAGARSSFEFLVNLSPERARTVTKLREARERSLSSGDAPEQRLVTLERIANQFADLGSVEEEFQTRSKAYETSKLLRRQIVGCAGAALECARRSERPRQICDALYDQARAYLMAGVADPIGPAIGEAMAVATESRLPRRAAEVAFFYSGYQHSRGRQGLAAELRELAVDHCREFGDQRRELDYLVMAMSIHVAYETWEFVERTIPRARQLLDEIETAGSRDPPATIESPGARNGTLSDYRKTLDLYEALGRLQEGHPSEALAILEKIEGTSDPTILYHRAEFLIENDQPDEAIAQLEMALPIVRMQKNRLLELRMLLRKAQAFRIAHELDEAEASLQEFAERSDGLGQSDLWTQLEADVLRAWLADARDDGAARRIALGRAYALLSEFLESSNASAEDYIYVARSEDLRSALRSFARSPAEGYEVEMAWRGTFEMMGRTGSHGPEGLDEFRTQGTAASEHTQGWLSRHSGLHLLFAVDGDQVLRWTVDGSEIELDTLSTSSEQLRSKIATAAERLAIDPESNRQIPADLTQTLEELAATLLPLDRIDHLSGPILITPDDFVQRLPFEALDLDPTADYRPLLATRDVAYLRAGRLLPNEAPSRPGLILADPTLPLELRRRYSGLHDLYFGRIEAGRIAEMDPRSRLYVGDEASLDRLLLQWESAGFIYLASHVVRDPNNPYWTFLPLAVDPRSRLGPEASRLEIIDVRQANLSECRLVVLSGCASGAPRVTRTETAPSLADAFIDAGAHAVVYTFWKVRDESAKELMVRFVDSWEDNDPVTALCRARRERMMPDSPRHPFEWSAFAIQIGGLPEN